MTDEDRARELLSAWFARVGMDVDGGDPEIVAWTESAAAALSHAREEGRREALRRAESYAETLHAAIGYQRGEDARNGAVAAWNAVRSCIAALRRGTGGA